MGAGSVFESMFRVVSVPDTLSPEARLGPVEGVAGCTGTLPSFSMSRLKT